MAAPRCCSSVTLFGIGLLLGVSLLVLSLNPKLFIDYRNHRQDDDFTVSVLKADSLFVLNQTNNTSSSPVSDLDHLSSDSATSLPELSSSTGPAPAPATSHGGNFNASIENKKKKKKMLQKPSLVIRKIGVIDKIEEELAKARAAIRRAVLNENYTSDMEQGFVPRGSIYRNPAAFHQSHREMVRRFKVWTYTEGEPPLFHDGPVNDIYGIEGQFIDEMSSEGRWRSPFRANNPGEAHAFFVPFSVAKVIHFVYRPITSVDGFSRARLNRLFEDYVAVVAAKYPYWNRSHGGDHFMMSCHDWAPDVIDGNPKLFENFIRGLCNANTSEGFRPNVDVSIPEINVPKGKLSLPLMQRPPPSSRSVLAFFAGRAHGRIRKVLFKHWKEKDDDVQVYERLPSDKNYMKLMGQSRFCLCPSGWEVASPREVEAIHAGCVPVIISDNYSLPFNDVLNWDKFSVQIPTTKIPEIKTILQSISQRRYLMMYKRVIGVRRHFVLNRPAQPYDVMHMMLHSVWLRRLNLRLAPI